MIFEGLQRFKLIIDSVYFAVADHSISHIALKLKRFSALLQLLRIDVDFTLRYFNLPS